MKITLRYSLFAAMAILVNIGSQELVLLIYQGSLALYPAILTGTVTGLVFKYMMDKRYIFNFQSKNVNDNLSTFTLYTLTGIATTLLFWATELAFDWYFDTRTARYTGAVLGLTTGYLIKYHLDKRFVFVAPQTTHHLQDEMD